MTMATVTTMWKHGDAVVACTAVGRRSALARAHTPLGSAQVVLGRGLVLDGARARGREGASGALVVGRRDVHVLGFFGVCVCVAVACC